jgi:Fe-S-cluster containining protein
MNRKQQRIAEKKATLEHVQQRRSLALKVFDEVDGMVEREIARSAAAGRPATCSKGCSHCCRQEIYVPRAEAEAMVQWLEGSAPHVIADLKVKIAAWLHWYRSEYPKLTASGVTRREALSSHGPECPALLDGACSIYPVRPIFCRTHYVTSPADACRAAGDPARLDVPIESMRMFAKAAPIGVKLRALIESQGADFNGTVHLLAEWLAHLLGIEQQPWQAPKQLR